MRNNQIWILVVSLLLTCCTKEGNTIYLPTPSEEQPATTSLVTMLYGPNGLGDRSYFDQATSILTARRTSLSKKLRIEPCAIRATACVFAFKMVI